MIRGKKKLAASSENFELETQTESRCLEIPDIEKQSRKSNEYKSDTDRFSIFDIFLRIKGIKLTKKG